MFRAGLYARVSTDDQQTLTMQNRAMREYLDHLERTKFLAPSDSDVDLDDLDDEIEDEPWLENPIIGVQELLRFSRARQLLQL